MSEQPNWKIVPGAEHRALKDEYSAIPTAVFEDEDIVYYRLKTYHDDGTSTIHGLRNSTLDAFRRMYAPEDQSCIPFLVAALKAFEWADSLGNPNLKGWCNACKHRKNEGHAEGCAVYVALRKAGAQ
jgi:hypothetical protein